MAKKKTAPPKKKPSKKRSSLPDSFVMTREEFERTDPLNDQRRRDGEFVARGFPPSSRPLTDKEVDEMRHLIIRDSVGAASRLLVEVKRLRTLVYP